MSINLPNSFEKDDSHPISENFEDAPSSEYLRSEHDENNIHDDFKGTASQNKSLELKPSLEKPMNFEPIRDFSIDQWNGSPGLSVWGYTQNKDKNFQKLQNIPCNTLRGSFDGIHS